MVEIIQSLHIQARLCPSMAIVRFFLKFLGRDHSGQSDFLVLNTIHSTSK